jgi:hypothetical protein
MTRKRDFYVSSVAYPLVLLAADQERVLATTGFAEVESFGTYRLEPYVIEISERLSVGHRR